MKPEWPQIVVKDVIQMVPWLIMGWMVLGFCRGMCP
jgi:hypothetical protein